MFGLYNFLFPLLLAVAKVAAFFNPKIRRGIAGRKSLLESIRVHYSNTVISGPRILIHVASYGELEQAKPVISEIKKEFRGAHVNLTFFSPSGYENVVGKYSDADLISYSPFDRRKDVSRFLDLAKPELALFTRYDVWPMMAHELKRKNIPSILFTATATEGSFRRLPLIHNFYRSIYQSLTKILTVSDEDKRRFEIIGIEPKRIEVAGDTRFDQVIARRQQLEQSGEHLLPQKIRSNVAEEATLVFIVGSSWSEDEAVYLKDLKQSVERKDNILTIIAPHETDETRISKLIEAFPGRAIRYSDIEKWKGEPIIIVDSIGKLFGLYRYADIAMIGGGFGAGLHNVLEAAAWGIPAIVGPKHQKSGEVNSLIDRLGAYEVKRPGEFHFVFWRLAESEDLRLSSGNRAKEFVEENCGAAERVLNEIRTIIGWKST